MKKRAFTSYVKKNINNGNYDDLYKKFKLIYNIEIPHNELKSFFNFFIKSCQIRYKLIYFSSEVKFNTFQFKRYLIASKKYPQPQNSVPHYYIEKWGLFDGLKKYFTYREKTKIKCTLNAFIKRYGEEKGKKKWKEFCDHNKGNLTKERKINLYGKEEGEKKYKEMKNKFKKRNTLEYYIERFGEKIGTKKYYDKNKKNSISSKKFAKSVDPDFYDKISLKSFIKRYGKNEGEQKYKKMIEKLSIPLKDQFLLKYGNDWEMYYNTHIKKIAQNKINFLSRHGPIVGFIKYEKWRKKRFTKEYYIEKYGKEIGEKFFIERSIEVQNKVMKTKIENGIATPLNKKEDFEMYSILVDKITKKQPIQLLPNYDKRSHYNFNEKGYHLDHKISKFDGFTNNIPVHIIGSISNLQFIPLKENCSKRMKSYSSLKNSIKKYEYNCLNEDCIKYNIPQLLEDDIYDEMPLLCSSCNEYTLYKN